MTINLKKATLIISDNSDSSINSDCVAAVSLWSCSRFRCNVAIKFLCFYQEDFDFGILFVMVG